MIDSPVIMFSNINVEQIVAYWLGVDIEFVYSYLGIILNKIGFRNDDNIYVYGYTKDSYLLLMVNETDEYKILMSRREIDDKQYNPVLFYDNECFEEGYECILDKYDRLEIDFKEIKYNNIEVSRLIEDIDEYEDIVVNNKEYFIEFRISKVGNGLYNINMIRDYLSNIELPMSILDIYKGIIEISNIDDISVYSLVDLRVIDTNYDIVEMMMILNGKIADLLINKDGKVISCDNMDNWCYESDKALVDFSMNRNGNTTYFNSKVRLKDDIDENSYDLVNEYLDIAKDEVNNVKKLVKKIVILGDKDGNK